MSHFQKFPRSILSSLLFTFLLCHLRTLVFSLASSGFSSCFFCSSISTIIFLQVLPLFRFFLLNLTYSSWIVCSDAMHISLFQYLHYLCADSCSQLMLKTLLFSFLLSFLFDLLLYRYIRPLRLEAASALLFSSFLLPSSLT